jgi:predicted TIM-barrel fold metal-dependent hydrolase
MTADRWMAEFDELGLKEESRRKILLDNARTLFRL